MMFRAWRRWLQKRSRPTCPGIYPKRRICLEPLEDRTLPSFVAAPTFPVAASSALGSNPVAIVTGDFNHDGKLDIATANQDSNTVSILLGNGNGTFRSPIVVPVGKSPEALVAVDLTGNGNLDLVTANNGDNSISVLMGKGNGTFKPAVTYAAGAGPVALAFGDFNGAGHVDLAVADNGSNTVTLLLGDGTGRFTPGGTVTVGNHPTSIAVADFTDDGRPDIATVSGGFGYLDVNLNNGDGTFAAPVNYTTGFSAHSVVVGDFNHDGQPDLAVACAFPSVDGVSILLGNADGTFQPFKKYSVGGQTPATLAVADLTGNGIQDIVTANGQFDNNSVSVLMGDGDGTFGTCSVYAAGQAPRALAVGDFNNDGVPDVVAADSKEDTVSLMLGNGDGTLLAAPDLVVSGPGAAVEADFTGDGIPDLAVITTSLSYSGVEIFPGNGDGTFGTPLFTPQIDSPTGLAVGDFTGNHKMDLAVSTANGVTILLNNGDGTFGTPYDYAAGPNPAWIAVADFTGNGKLDLAVANDASSGGVSILLGNGDGTFGPATSVAAGGAAIYLATGDFNGDHKEDLAVLNGSNSTVSIVLGNGDGTFGPAKTYKTAIDPASVGVGDFTSNGKPDLAVPSFFGLRGGNLSIFMNGKGDNFGLKSTYKVGTRPIGIAVTDLNGDGKLDLLTANNFSDDVSVYSGTGKGTFAAAATYVVGDGPTWLVPADLNQDGLPDLAVVNSDSGTVTLLETPRPATHFSVRVLPAAATAGTSFKIMVTALDGDNHLVTGYAGTVSFTSTDAAATLPKNYKFTAADHGTHIFTVTLRTAGSTDIVVHAGIGTHAATGTVSGSGSITVLAAAASHFQISAAQGATAGSAFDVTVTALDPFGNVAVSYRGTIHFSTTDPNKSVTIPQDYTFTADDSGVHTFPAGVTLLTAGQRTITVIDKSKSTIAGSARIAVSSGTLS